MIDWDKPVPDDFIIIARSGLVTGEDRAYLYRLLDGTIDTVLEKLREEEAGQDQTHPCGQWCIANVDGRCAVQDCRGAARSLRRTAVDVELAAKYYDYMTAEREDGVHQDNSGLDTL